MLNFVYEFPIFKMFLPVAAAVGYSTNRITNCQRPQTDTEDPNKQLCNQLHAQLSKTDMRNCLSQLELGRHLSVGVDPSGTAGFRIGPEYIRWLKLPVSSTIPQNVAPPEKTPQLGLVQQVNGSGGFQTGHSAWLLRSNVDLSRNQIQNKIFSEVIPWKSMSDLDFSVPTALSIDPDYEPSVKSYLSGTIELFTNGPGDFKVSIASFGQPMDEAIIDTRQTVIVVTSGKLIVQSYGIVPNSRGNEHEVGDVVTIPSNTPFRIIVPEGQIASTLSICSKTDMKNPKTTLAHPMNQPISPFIFSPMVSLYNESPVVPFRDIVAKNQSGKNEQQVYFKGPTPFDVSAGKFSSRALPSSVNVKDMPRSDVDVGHPDPDTWTVLGNESLQMAIIRGFIQRPRLHRSSNGDYVQTFNPPYAHVNGKFEFGILFLSKKLNL